MESKNKITWPCCKNCRYYVPVNNVNFWCDFFKMFISTAYLRMMYCVKLPFPGYEPIINLKWLFQFKG